MLMVCPIMVISDFMQWHLHVRSMTYLPLGLGESRNAGGEFAIVVVILTVWESCLVSLDKNHH